MWINACSLCNKFQERTVKNQSCDVTRDSMHSQSTGGHVLCHIVVTNQSCMGESSMYTDSQTILNIAQLNC